MISITFIFPNTDSRIQKKFKGTQKIYQIKENLKNSSLPGQTDAKIVDYLRFFSMGKELEDDKTLSSYPIHDPSHPLPIHVHAIYNNAPKLDSTCCGYCVVV